ncbi:MAG: hypothetical protein AAGB01_04635, partial [Cyanobacteria bacterium P01_F01_bin.42]
MMSKLLGATIFVLPFTMYPAASNAESWKDWTRQNPTYGSSETVPSAVSSDTSEPQVLPTSPAQGGRPAFP